MRQLYAPVPGLPRPGTFGACAPSTALSHNRVRPPSGPYATQSETPKESVAPCPRELTGENSPHLYRGEKTEKPHQQNATFLVFYTLGDLEDRVCDLGLECFAFIRWRKPL